MPDVSTWVGALNQFGEGLMSGDAAVRKTAADALKAKTEEEKRENLQANTDRINQEIRANEADLADADVLRYRRNLAEAGELDTKIANNRINAAWLQGFNNLTPAKQAEIIQLVGDQARGLTDARRTEAQTNLAVSQGDLARAKAITEIGLFDSRVAESAAQARALEIKNEYDVGTATARMREANALLNQTASRAEFETKLAAIWQEDALAFTDAYYKGLPEEVRREFLTTVAEDALGLSTIAYQKLDQFEHMMRNAGIIDDNKPRGQTSTNRALQSRNIRTIQDIWSEPEKTVTSSGITGNVKRLPISRAAGEIDERIRMSIQHRENNAARGLEYQTYVDEQMQVGMSRYLSQMEVLVGPDQYVLSRQGNTYLIDSTWAAELGLSDHGSTTAVDSVNVEGTDRTLVGGAFEDTLVRVAAGPFQFALVRNAQTALTQEIAAADPTALTRPDVSEMYVNSIDAYLNAATGMAPGVVADQRRMVGAIRTAMEAERKAALRPPARAPAEAPQLYDPIFLRRTAGVGVHPEQLSVVGASTVDVNWEYEVAAYDNKTFAIDALAQLAALGPDAGTQLVYPGRGRFNLVGTDEAGNQTYADPNVAGRGMTLSEAQIDYLVNSGAAHIERGELGRQHDRFVQSQELAALIPSDLDDPSLAGARPPEVHDPVRIAKATLEYQRDLNHARQWAREIVRLAIKERQGPITHDSLEAVIGAAFLTSNMRDRSFIVAAFSPEAEKELRAYEMFQALGGRKVHPPDYFALIGSAASPLMVQTAMHIPALISDWGPVIADIQAGEAAFGGFQEDANAGGEVLDLSTEESNRVESAPTGVLRHSPSLNLLPAMRSSDPNQVDGAFGAQELLQRGRFAVAVDQGISVDIPDTMPDGGTVASALNNPGALKLTPRMKSRQRAGEGANGLASFDTPETGFAALFDHTQIQAQRRVSLGKFLSNYGDQLDTPTEVFEDAAMAHLRADVPQYRSDHPLATVDILALSRILARVISGSTVHFDGVS